MDLSHHSASPPAPAPQLQHLHSFNFFSKHNHRENYMDEMLGVYWRGDEEGLMPPENLMIPAEYYCDESAASAVNLHEYEEDSSLIKAKISSHPSYSKLLDAYIDCQKVGAPPEIERVLDEIRREKDICKQDDVSMCLGVDPQLDHFMETYCDLLLKYKSDLSLPFHEATSFLTDIQTQLLNLCHGVSWEEEIEIEGAGRKREDEEVKEKLLRMYGNHITSLRLDFSKKKKNGKLPKEATQTLLAWWNMHSQWPYPTEADKIGMAETTGLDQKQINNWFINQRKRHWKSPHFDVANTNNELPHCLQFDA